MADGTIYVLTFDAEKPDLVSVSKDSVQASMAISGWKL
jgi:hypothetical protein